MYRIWDVNRFKGKNVNCFHFILGGTWKKNAFTVHHENSVRQREIGRNKPNTKQQQQKRYWKTAFFFSQTPHTQKKSWNSTKHTIKQSIGETIQSIVDIMFFMWEFEHSFFFRSARFFLSRLLLARHRRICKQYAWLHGSAWIMWQSDECY